MWGMMWGSWEDDVRNDLRKMGVTNWKQRTQERKQWKEIIGQAKIHKELYSWKKKKKNNNSCPPSMARKPLVGQSLLIFQPTHTPHSGELLWKGYRPDAVTSTRQDTTLIRHKTMSRAGFEPTILASERPRTHAFDRAAPEIGNSYTG